MKKKHNLPRTCRHVWGWMNLLNGVPLHSHSRRANMSVWPVMVVSPSPFGLTFVNPTDPVQMEEVGEHRMNGFNHNNDIGKGITTTPLSMGTGQITGLFDILGTGWRRRKSTQETSLACVEYSPNYLWFHLTGDYSFHSLSTEPPIILVHCTTPRMSRNRRDLSTSSHSSSVVQRLPRKIDRIRTLWTRSALMITVIFPNIPGQALKGSNGGDSSNRRKQRRNIKALEYCMTLHTNALLLPVHHHNSTWQTKKELRLWWRLGMSSGDIKWRGLTTTGQSKAEISGAFIFHIFHKSSGGWGGQIVVGQCEIMSAL